VRDEILPDGVPGWTLHLPVRDVTHLGQGRIRGVQRSVVKKRVDLSRHCLWLMGLCCLLSFCHSAVCRAPGQEGTRDLHRPGHDWRAGRNGIDVCYYLCRPAIV